MRITTKMLNQSAIQAGMPMRGASLLNYVKNGNGNKNLLSGLSQKKAANSSHAMDKTNFEKLEQSADKVGTAAAALLGKDKDSLFNQAVETGDYGRFWEQINSLADSYNDTLKNLERMPGALNTFYKESLTEAATKSKDLLEKVGFSVAKDGSFLVNQDKLKNADKEDLQKAFGAESDLTKQLQFVASHISKGAKANLDSANMRYAATGNTYSPNFSRYDFRS
ncbi:MAG: hypothetical protein IJ833_00990 [Lachnospiraceae bacterium]|nr:hypothetical protein [Lachnospiraceae bacterium]